MLSQQVQTGISLVVDAKNLCDKLPRIGRYFFIFSRVRF
jgi:hypothetical protein